MQEDKGSDETVRRPKYMAFHCSQHQYRYGTLGGNIFAFESMFMPKNYFFIYYTKTWLPPLGCQTSPSQGVATGQKLENPTKRKKNYLFILSFTHLLIHSLVLQELCHRIGCRPLDWRHRSDYTQAHPIGPHCTSVLPPEPP